MGRGTFFCQEKGESRYEEKIPDRARARGTKVSSTRQRRESADPDDAADGGGGWPLAGRSGTPFAGSRTGVDEPGDGGGSAALGRRAASTTPPPSGTPLGEGSWLLCGGRAKGAAAENPPEKQRKPRAAAGELRTVPAERAVGGGGVGQDDAGAIDAELRSGGEGFPGGLWDREVGGERQLHRGQPREAPGIDGAALGGVAALCRVDRRHSVPGPPDDRGAE